MCDSKVVGLTIRVSPGGTKTFSLRYRVGGKSRNLKLGRYPTLSLQEARERAQTALRTVADGRDPATEKIKANTNYKSELFSSVAEQFIELYAKPKTRSWSNTEQILQREFLPVWKNFLTKEIRRQDVNNILDRIMASPTFSTCLLVARVVPTTDCRQPIAA